MAEEGLAERQSCKAESRKGGEFSTAPVENFVENCGNFVEKNCVNTYSFVN